MADDVRQSRPAAALPTPPAAAAGVDPLELAAVVALIAVLVTAALHYYQLALFKSATVEAFAVTQTLRYDVLAFQARHGRWPSTAEVAPPRSRPGDDVGNNVATVEVGDGGALTVTFNDDLPALAGRHLTLRPVVVPDQPSTTVRWTCGRRAPAPPAVALGTDRTDLPDDLLVHVCRNGVAP